MNQGFANQAGFRPPQVLIILLFTKKSMLALGTQAITILVNEQHNGLNLPFRPSHMLLPLSSTAAVSIDILRYFGCALITV